MRAPVPACALLLVLGLTAQVRADGFNGQRFEPTAGAAG